MSKIEIIAKSVVDSAIKVHKALGPGLLESVYQKCLAYELRQKGFDVKTEIPVPIEYGEVTLDTGFRLDMRIDNQIIIENKTVEKLLPIHKAQLITYLKLTGIRIGFLLNWNVVLMKDGIKRMIND